MHHVVPNGNRPDESGDGMNSSTTPETLGELTEELAQNPLLGALRPEFRQMIAGCATVCGFDKGERLLLIGEPCSHFWLIRDGRIDVEIHGPPFGRLTIDRLEPGEILGLSWIAAPFTAEFDATAVEPGTAVRVDADCLRAECSRHHELGRVVYQSFATLIRDRLHATRVQLLNLYEPKHGI